MRLADAVEKWGISHRSALEESETEAVRRIWSTLRQSRAGFIDLTELEPNDTVRISQLFPSSDRVAAERIIGEATTWVSENPSTQTRTRSAGRSESVQSAQARALRAQEAALDRRRRVGIVLATISGLLLAALVAFYLLYLG